MKKFILSTILCISICAVSLVYKSKNNSMSTIALTNIEALSGNESDSGEVVKCYCKSNIFSKTVCSAEGSGAYCGGNPCANHDGNCR